MNTSVVSPVSDVEELVGRIADEFTERLNRGEQPEIDEYAARHPEIAELLRQVLPALELIRLPGGADPSGGNPDGGTLEAGVLGDYRILGELGRGGMGVVYKAEQISLGRTVALKVLPFAGALDSRQLMRFQNEARAAACLHHPNIVPVFAIGCERAVHFYAMQYIEGESLEALLQEMRHARKPTPPASADDPDATSAEPRPSNGQSQRETLREPRGRASTLPSPKQNLAYFRRIAELGVEAARALDHAHEVGVVHRDIKPANLMLDGRGKLWMTDFGLAQIRTDTRLTLTGDLVGTLRYMSPEQALAKRVIVDHRTDIYSLGATLYELLTLEPVFDGADREELLRQIAFEDPVAPRQIDKTIALDLETIVLKAIEKNPNDRYGSAKELADDLTRYVNNEPTLARRPTLWQRGRKWSQRHVAAVRATVAVLFFVTLVVTGVLLDRASRLATTEQQVREALAGARTAIEAGDLTLANRRVGEAHGYLGIERENLRASAADTDLIQKEIKDRQGDEARLRQFVQLASDAQDKMSYGSVGGDALAKDALDLYRVLDADDWLKRLENFYLSPDQKEQVRETSYVTLVSLADWCVRWNFSSVPNRGERLDRCLDLLKRAEAFHAPTRAYLFVCSEYHHQKGETAASQEYRDRFASATAVTAWDYFLPGHTAGWKGDLQEAIRSYEAALDLQPDHYNSLFYLGERLSFLKRYAEAIPFYRACEILRPNHLIPYSNRLRCYVESGRLEELEAQEVVLLKRYQGSSGLDSQNTLSRLRLLTDVYEKAGKLDGTVRLGQQVIEHQRNAKALDAGTLAQVGRILLKRASYREAEPLLRECLTIREQRTPENWLRFNAQSMLGEALLGQTKYAEAERHLQEGYQGVKARVMTIPEKYREIREREIEDRLPRLYDAWGKNEEAAKWRATFESSSFVRSWLILSELVPYDINDPVNPLDQPQIAAEDRLCPRAGDRIQVGDRALVWKEHQSAGKYIDLADAYRKPSRQGVAYMVCYIHAEGDLDAKLSVASDDTAKVYLNGQEVHQSRQFRGLQPDTTPIALKKGSNVLVFKVVNGGGAWGGILRVYRTDDLPTRGLKFRLTP